MCQEKLCPFYGDAERKMRPYGVGKEYKQQLYVVTCAVAIVVPRNGLNPPNKPHMNHINMNYPHCRKYGDHADINKSSRVVHRYPRCGIPIKLVSLETPNK